MSDLFVRMPVQFHSGSLASWKIECDALSDQEIDTIALMFSEFLCPFGRVVGVPSGGLKLARALEKYRSEGPLLIVDDVLTTGNSMVEVMLQENAERTFGAVIFARGKCPGWVVPLFQMPVGL